MPSGAQPFADALELAVNIGPLGLALRENPDRREAVMAVLPSALEPYLTDGVVRFPTSKESFQLVFCHRSPGSPSFWLTAGIPFCLWWRLLRSSRRPYVSVS